MQLATLILSILAVIIAVLSFVFRKPGPQGPQGETGLRGIPGEDGHDGLDGMNGKDGVTPKFKIEKGVLRVSYNEGKTYQDLGKVKGEKGATGAPGKDAVVIDGSKQLTRDVIESALLDSEGRCQFTKPVSAPVFYQEDKC